MKNKFVKTGLVKIVCECCGHEFYAEPGIKYCPECERHWNED